jgi:tRNA1Val (adenine37-N6)-methyltransferase
MPQPYFQFKQFTVWHNQCAMKVGTDGVLLGTWAPINDKLQTILDIGCGSGLIALILAQRNPSAHITGIDIDEGAYNQSRYNFNKSCWNNRLEALHTSLQTFSSNRSTQFDLIVSNPPFFSKSLKAPCQARSTARHNDFLPLEILMVQSEKLLKETGSIALILPVTDQNNCVKCAERVGLYCVRSTTVYPKPGASAKRILMVFKKNFHPLTADELTIETITRGVYTPEFEALTQAFYLKL